MSTTTSSNGRLGNQIIRNLAVSIIAEKHNLYVNYCNYDYENYVIFLYSESIMRVPVPKRIKHFRNCSVNLHSLSVSGTSVGCGGMRILQFLENRGSLGLFIDF